MVALIPHAATAASAAYHASAIEMRTSFNMSAISPSFAGADFDRIRGMYAKDGIYLHRDGGDGGALVPRSIYSFLSEPFSLRVERECPDASL